MDYGVEKKLQWGNTTCYSVLSAELPLPSQLHSIEYLRWIDDSTAPNSIEFHVCT